VERYPTTPPALRLHPGWPFLLAGLALLCAVLVVSAQREVEEVRHARDRALAVEQHREARMLRYKEFLAALDERQPALIESLAGSQLNMIPAQRAAIPGTVHDYAGDASIFPALEPQPLRMPELRRGDSVLSRLARSDTMRLWLLAGATVLILVGLLPDELPGRAREVGA
jgi:hypothetical protein